MKLNIAIEITSCKSSSETEPGPWIRNYTPRDNPPGSIANYKCIIDHAYDYSSASEVTPKDMGEAQKDRQKKIKQTNNK